VKIAKIMESKRIMKMQPKHCRYAKEHLPLSCSLQRAFAVTSLFAKSICRYHALCKEHLPLPRSLQRAFAVTMLFAKSICRYHALSHNGNALFIALVVGLIDLN
jgi:hypothetical protein